MASKDADPLALKPDVAPRVEWFGPGLERESNRAGEFDLRHGRRP
jgi:hypothetical protein